LATEPQPSCLIICKPKIDFPVLGVAMQTKLALQYCRCLLQPMPLSTQQMSWGREQKGRKYSERGWKQHHQTLKEDDASRTCLAYVVLTECWIRKNADGRAHTHSPSYICSNGEENKLRGLSPRANYTDREAAACWRSRGCCVEAQMIPTAVFSFSRTQPLHFLPSSSSVILTRLSRPRSRHTTSQKIW
jgi:hypothetical protein